MISDSSRNYRFSAKISDQVTESDQNFEPKSRITYQTSVRYQLTSVEIFR